VNGTLLVRIWDPDLGGNGLPNDSVGKVTITGTFTSGQLRILVAGTGDSWSDDPDELIVSSGLLHLGLNSDDGIVVTDATLRARTRLSAYTAGDIRGTIELGQVQRVQCGADPFNPAGTISANISTLANTNSFSAGENPIAAIIAGDAITGTITATLGTIGLVVVGPHADAAGISGDIIAEQGDIRSIFSTGPIGNATTAVNITAANGIGEIRTIAESDPGTVLARDVFATITAHQAILDNPENFPYNQPSSDGPLELLEVGGDLHGEIRAANILGSNNSGDRRGIIVRGICYAPINIEFVVDHANILAQTFLAPIRIGRTMRGAIVATGGATTPIEPPPGYTDGHIPSIIIGDLDDFEVPAAVLTNYFPNIRGLGGIFGVRSDIPDGEDWFTAVPVSGTALDSCVRAQSSIGEAFIASLTIQQFSQPNTFGCQKYSPVVEAPVIGSIIIQDLAAGTVWSGQYDEMDPGSEYAAIGEILIGCVGRQGTIRATGWSSFVVEHNMFGDIHVPTVPAGAMIRIGGILGNDQDAIYEGDLGDELCRCSVHAAPGCEDCVRTSNYYSFENNHVLGGFRNPNAPYYGRCTTAAPDNRGQIWVHQNEGLHGQIIINASNTGLPQAALWTGAVQVGETTGGCPLLEISPTPSSAEWESPHYDGLSAALGGGAVGLVPFTLHGPNCTPPLDVTTPPIFLSSALFHLLDPQDNETIVLDFRGPVTTEAVADAPFVIHRLTDTEEFDFSIMFMVDVKRAPHDQGPPNSRAVSLRGAGVEYSYLIDEGVFGLRFLRDDPPRTLLCDATRTEFGVPVAPLPQGQDYDYSFVVRRDCNLNGIWDTDDIAADPSLDLDFDGRIDSCYESTPCEPDINGDGNVDQDDHACLVQTIGGDWSCLGEGIDPDFNGDGNIDQDDVAALETVIAGGACP
jgi:hypothetical protein